MSAVSEFESILQELPTIKAPGVSGSRIKKLTDIAVKNVAEESQLVLALYNSCKSMPSSHKLGALYVVDSIVRVYKEEAKKKGENIDANAPEGTFAAGVNKITGLIESIMDDAMLLLVVPSTDVKISKLVDIWERAQTFSPQILANIRNKHFRSTTPPGSPPSKAAPPPPPASAKPEGDSGSILLALASLAKKTETPTPPAVASPGAQQAAPSSTNNNAANILSQLSALAGSNQNNGHSPAAQQQSIRSPSYQNAQPAQAPPAHLPNLPQIPQIPQQQGQNQQIFSMLQQMQSNPGSSQLPPPSSHGMPGMPNQGYPNPAGLPPVPGMPPMPPQGHGGYNDRGYPPQQQQYERRGRDDGGYLRRNRSRSPPRGHGNFSPHPPQEKDKSLSHGFAPHEGERNIPGAPHYRPRNVGFDNSIPQGSFKVLSRTLFIGGVPRGMDERALAGHLRPYAEVQSVILNSERKHAFVKVYSRREAEAVVQSFNKDGALPLRTRWGVGFGPRDCCNYQHGVSIIPIVRLTDADKQWVVDAEWGGTGGQPLVSGIVIDEPDIEIGTGISSKAMSKKMPTNSTRNGPKSNRPGEDDDQYVKTSMDARPNFNGMGNGAPNPLSGLFNQPPQGYPGQMPMQAQQQPPQGYPPNFGNQQNPNLGAQLANFFQNGGQQR